MQRLFQVIEKNVFELMVTPSTEAAQNNGKKWSKSNLVERKRGGVGETD